LPELPSSIQDTISVTWGLSVRFVWIDSLCIIQDSKNDWLREAQKMRHVYRNCIVVIATLGPIYNNQGLFAYRD
ncbi:HET-domain-containing protein, partial [Lojkania enalia]